MTLYDEIKNPFEDDNKIIEITNIYSNDNGHSLYTNFVTDSDYDSKARNDYLRSFNNCILYPCSREFYNYLKKQKPEEYDKNLLKTMKGIIVRPDITKNRKLAAIDNIKSRYIYPLSKYSQILKQFESFDDLNRYFYAVVGPKIYDIERYMQYKEDKNYDKMKEIEKKLNLSETQIEFWTDIDIFRRSIFMSFDGGDGVMGFHVRPDRLNPDIKVNYKPDIKFYINAGSDTYQFASLFKEECEKQGMVYFFKVANPRWSECSRLDKMCIWSSYKDAQKIIDILRKIRNNHPEFKYSAPPVLCGTIDGFIGVGQDFNRSYNKGMISIIETAMKNCFSSLNKELYPKIVATNPAARNKLRDEIKNVAIQNDLDSEKLCIKNGTKEKLEKVSKTNGLKANNQLTDENVCKYIRELLKCVDYNNITIYDYYLKIVLRYCKNQTDKIPPFEKYNPFISEKDINMLQAADDTKTLLSFASDLTNTVEKMCYELLIQPVKKL